MNVSRRSFLGIAAAGVAGCAIGDSAKNVGGHGGMDFVMDLRWAYCLQNGLPLDTDVYDLATYSSIVELSIRPRDVFVDSGAVGAQRQRPFRRDRLPRLHSWWMEDREAVRGGRDRHGQV